MNRHARRQSGGFTLTEALAAGMVLALSASALGLIVSQSIRSLASARDYQQAAELLDATLTKIDTVGPAMLLEFGPTDGVFDQPNERFSWKATISRQLTGHLYDVTVSVRWETASGKQRSAKAQTYLNDPRTVLDSRLRWSDL